jgi:hypothetical protein
MVAIHQPNGLVLPLLHRFVFGQLYSEQAMHQTGLFDLILSAF